MSQKWRKFSPEFRQQALERMKTCSNVTALARELGIRRKWLYAWRDQQKTKAESSPQVPEERAITALSQRIAELEQLAGKQAAEIDFFKGALRRIKEARQSSSASGGAASTTKSEA